MKSFILPMLMLGVLTTACNKTQPASTLLQNPDTQKEIYSAILDDSVYLNQFMQSMHDKYGRNGGMMRGRMMRQMYGPGMMRDFMMDSTMLNDSTFRYTMFRHMFNRADRDSLFCRQMSNAIMNHEPIRRRLMQRMGQ